MPQSLRQFLVFASVGAVGTLGHYVVLIALVESELAFSPTLASACGFVVGATINYILNYRLTFASTKAHAQTLPRFMLIAAFGVLLNTLIMLLGTQLIGLNYLVSQVVATGCVLLVGYTANRVWTFAVPAR